MKSLNLFIFVDALGWEIVQKRSFLSDLLEYQSPCETVFGYSSTCDPTILTGKMPDEHGHFSFFVHGKQERPFKSLSCLGFLPQKLAGHHRIRNRVSRWVGAQKGYTGYFQLYSVPFNRLGFLDYTEKSDIYQPGGIIGGFPSIFEYWEKSEKAWYCSDWRKGDDTNIQELKRTLSKSKVELAYLFTAGLDALMHRYGTEGPQVDAGFAEFEQKIRGVVQWAEQFYDDVRVCMFSDHGMADTTSSSDLMIRWENLGFEYGKDYIACWDSTMVRFWFLGNKQVEEEALAFLREQPDGELVSKEQLKQWGCLFEGDYYGEYFYLLPAGRIFVPSFMNQKWVKGMHGYDPADIHSKASFSSNFELEHPKALKDIFSVMLKAADMEESAIGRQSLPQMPVGVN